MYLIKFVYLICVEDRLDKLGNIKTKAIIAFQSNKIYNEKRVY